MLVIGHVVGLVLAHGRAIAVYDSSPTVAVRRHEAAVAFLRALEIRDLMGDAETA